MPQIVIKKKHLRYAFYICVLLTTSLLRQEVTSPGLAEDGLSMETNFQREHQYNTAAPKEIFDNQNSPESSHSDVAINTGSAPIGGSKFSNSLNFEKPESIITDKTSGSSSITQAPTSPSIGLQIYEAAEERGSTNKEIVGPQSSFAKYKSFASVGGAFGGGALPLDGHDDEPPGGPENPTPVPLDTETYYVLVIGVLIGFFTLRKKKIAI